MAETLDRHDIQGLVARAYGGLPEAAYLLLHVDQPETARAWLHGLADEVATVESAPSEAAVNVALTAPGLRELTGDAELVARFARQFVAGMVGEHKSRFLGDLDEDAPEGWAWGGPTTDAVHVLVLVFGADTPRLDARCEALLASAEASGLRLVQRLATSTLTPTEHFGFRDGIAQPALDGLGPGRTGQATVRSGEFVLGYPNEYDQYTERPLLPADADPDGLLPRSPAERTLADLGRNGSYLVFRQLHQDVAAFHAFVESAATDPSGRLDEQRRDLLAAKMMGRWPSGAPLVLAPEHDDPSLGEENDFGYHHTDEHGLACPIGAHVRRTNPRDSLEPSPGTDDSWAVNRKHRLLRRGRAYGTPADGGLHFICLNANLARQYEFVQHTWVNNPSFDGLYGEEDPVVGPRRRPTSFTEPAKPVRRRMVDLPRFVHVRGGGYFFLPGIAALRYLTRPAP